MNLTAIKFIKQHFQPTLTSLQLSMEVNEKVQKNRNEIWEAGVHSRWTPDRLIRYASIRRAIKQKAHIQHPHHYNIMCR